MNNQKLLYDNHTSEFDKTLMISSHGICQKCSVKCCHHENISLPLGHYNAIKKYINPEKEEISTNNKFLIPICDKSRECIFLDKTGCRIPKDMRPIICKLYPILNIGLDPLKIEITGKCPHGRELMAKNGIDIKSPMNPTIILMFMLSFADHSIAISKDEALRNGVPFDMKKCMGRISPIINRNFISYIPQQMRLDLLIYFNKIANERSRDTIQTMGVNKE